MIVYCVFDGMSGETGYYCRNLVKAREAFRDVETGEIRKVETVEPTKDGVIAMLNHAGFAIKQEVIETK